MVIVDALLLRLNVLCTTDDDVGDHEAWRNEDAEGLQDALQVETLSHDFVNVCVYMRVRE